MKFNDFKPIIEKMEQSNIQWINVWSSIPKHGQHFKKFSVTLPLPILIVVSYLYLILV